MNNFLEQWEKDSAENQRLVAEEELIVDVTEQIWEILDHKDISKSSLADALGKSRAYVSQILDGNRNMTLRTLADIALALGMKAYFGFRPIQPCCDWGQTSSIFLPAQHDGHVIVANERSSADWGNPITLRNKVA